jgi:two-component sensor histidine kinase
VAAITIENARLHEQTRQDAETKAMLLNEVNHRVKNNLTAIVGLLYTELEHKKMKNEATCQSIIRDLINRIQGLATAHSLLSAAEWRPLLLSDLTKRVIHVAFQSLPAQKRIRIEVVERSSTPIQITPKQASSLALVVNELATNTIKHGLPQEDISQVTLRVEVADETITLEYRDDGPGYPMEILEQAAYNVGLYLVKNIVCSDLRGTLNLHNDGGAVATIQFKAVESKAKA